MIPTKIKDVFIMYKATLKFSALTTRPFLECIRLYIIVLSQNKNQPQLALCDWYVMWENSCKIARQHGKRSAWHLEIFYSQLLSNELINILVTVKMLLDIREFFFQFQHQLYILCQSKKFLFATCMYKSRCWNWKAVLELKIRFFF